MARGGGSAPAPLVKVDRVVIATALSWLGLWAHELYRVPRLLGFTPDGDPFMLPIAAGFAFWWSRSRGASATLALAIYATVNLAGVVVTILPLGWLPFIPDQTAAHYAAHVIYAVCQLPLLTIAIMHLRRRREFAPVNVKHSPPPKASWPSRKVARTILSAGRA
jgi:hypothetical protein